VLAWLRTNVHAHGDRFTADEVIRRATGTALDTGAWFRHIDTKFS
jgi:carboxypeptidase Taq